MVAQSLPQPLQAAPCGNVLQGRTQHWDLEIRLRPIAIGPGSESMVLATFAWMGTVCRWAKSSARNLDWLQSATRIPCAWRHHDFSETTDFSWMPDSSRTSACVKPEGPVRVVGCRPSEAGERPVTTKLPTFATCPATLSS